MAEAEENVVQELSQETEKKSKKEASKILQCFSSIIKDNPKIRAKSGAVLIRELAAKNGGAENGTELSYVLSRLIRGLGATRNTSRIGFYTVFATLLRTPRVEVDIAEVLGLLEKELSTSKNNPKSENADILTGHVLVCGSILRSEQFKEVDRESRKKMVGMLVHAAKKRSYLSLPAHVFLVDAFVSLTPKEFNKSVLSVVKPELEKPLTDYTLDNLYFLLAAQDKFPGIISEELLTEIIGVPEIIGESTVGNIADILLSILPIKQILKHPVYELACRKVAASNCVQGFLARIDEVLLRPTMMRHQAAAVMLTFLVKNLPDTTLFPEIYTRNFILETLSHFKTLRSKNQDDLQLAVYELFDATVTALKAEGVKTKHKLAFIKRLLFYPGTFIFEKLTRSKIVQQIMATLNTDGVKKLCKIYQDVMLSEVEKQRNEEETESWLNLDRVYASQLIVKLLNHGTVKGEIEWKKEQLTVIMELGLLKDNRYRSVGCELSASLKETFFHALDLKMSKLDDIRSILSHLVHHFNTLLTEENCAPAMRNPISEASHELWSRTMAEVDKIENKSKKSHLYPVFHTLFLNMMLQLINDEKLATDSLNELFSCYERVKKEKKSRKMEVEEDNEEGDIKWIEVVVDLFLSLLSHNSHLLRSLITRVFPYLCKDLNANAIHQILSVLDPKSSDNPLSAKGESESESDGDDEEEESNDDSSESEDEDEEQEEETVNDKLKQAVRDALGAKGAESDEESVDMDAMSDSECEKLNAALGEAFKRFKPNLGKKSRKQNKDDETLTHFRVRVLDLIDLYLESPDVSMIYCLEIMLPLLQTLEFSVREDHQKPLQNRVRFCLKKLLSVKKFACVEGVDEHVLSDLLSSLLEKGTKTSLLIQEMGDKISECCIFTIQCAQYLCRREETPKKMRKKLKSRVSAIVLEAQEAFFTKRDCLVPYMLFKRVMGMVWDGITVLIPGLVGCVFNEELRPFRRSQALELLKIFYTNHRFLKANEESLKPQLAEIESTIQERAMEFFGNPRSANKKYVSCVFNLLVAIQNSPIKTDAIDWARMGAVVLDYRSKVVFVKDVKASFNKLCSRLKIPNVVAMKPNPIELSAAQDDQDDSISQASSKSGKRQRMSVEKRKLKKQTQLLRLQSLSEGFSDVHFGNADMNGVGMDYVESDKMDVNSTVGKNKAKRGNASDDISRSNGKTSGEGEDVPRKKKLKKK